MSTDDVIHVRLDALEEFRREQGSLNKSIGDTLHRIELALGNSAAKACPLPGHCVVLENSVKARWEGDNVRFERMEARLAENDDWHKAIEARMDGKLDVIKKELDSVRSIVLRASGGLGIILLLLQFLFPFVSAMFKHQ